eukprot:Clim_evm39s232 gene=Clim_evmTU39s232
MYDATPGVLKTTVGYTGGKKKNPTYHWMGDHTETVRIEYDPSQISTDELLNKFFNSHNSRGMNRSVQYRSAIFYLDDEQKKAALNAKKAYEGLHKTKSNTALEKAGSWYDAEEYHQKYIAKSYR